jgi:hypothetical protein
VIMLPNKPTFVGASSSAPPIPTHQHQYNDDDDDDDEEEEESEDEHFQPPTSNIIVSTNSDGSQQRLLGSFGDSVSQKQCFECDRVFSSDGRLSQHFRTRHGIDFESVDDQIISKRRRKPTKKADDYKCGQCHRSFTSEGRLNQHYKVTHSGSSFKKFKCFCKRTFTTEKRLHQHWRAHPDHYDLEDAMAAASVSASESSAPKPIQQTITYVVCLCPFCEQGFKDKTELGLHIYNEHSSAKSQSNQ